MNYPKLPSFRLDGKKALVTGAGRGTVSYTHLTLPTKA